MDQLDRTNERHDQQAMGRYLSFTLAKENFAIPLSQVKEVIALSEITPVPRAPAYCLGILNLRGTLISVIDLRLKLKTGTAERTPETSIIILDSARGSLGVVVDSVESVLAIPDSDVSASSELNSVVQSGCISGAAKHEDGLTLVLDLDKIIEAGDELPEEVGAKTA